MSRFALRIFLSTWVVLTVTAGLTIFSSRWLPLSGEAVKGRHYDDQVLYRLARDLRPHVGDAAAVEDIVWDHPYLELDRLMEVYVLDPEGRDVLGRELPAPVARLAEEDGTPALGDPRADVYRDGLGGYAVVSYHGRLPFYRVLAQPGVRGLGILIALASSAAASVVLARFVVLPVRRLRQAGQQVAEGDLSVRVAPTVGSRRDELAELARDFDAMTERVQGLLDSRQRLMRDVSHELRSPLARLQALLSIARQKLEQGEPVTLDRMERELERLDELIGEILAHARLETKEDVDRRPTDLVDLVQNIVDDATVEGQESGKQVTLEAPASCLLDVNGSLIQGAVENVVRNALKHAPPETTVDVTIEERPECVDIVIRDSGPGVPEEAIDKLFEPFYRVETARSTHSGSGGIGLAIAKRSIRLHGGTITAANRADGGLRIEMTLPHLG